jgi:NADH-quinone oxidoreductase subunit H
VLYLFALSSLSVYAIVMAGWAANNKYTLLGGLRSSAQMFSYELALGLSWIGIIMLTGSFRFGDIVRYQDGWLFSWFVFKQPLAFVIFLIAATAEANRTPFDLPEAETELVAGFHTEYSSMRFALLQMAEYVHMITISAVGANLFFGGWMSPIPMIPDSPLWFILKLAGFLFFFVWLRGTLPRFRYDQLMDFGWKVLVPLATLNLLVTAAIVVARQ